MIDVVAAKQVTPWVWRRSIIRSPDSKVHGANIGPIWDRQDPGGPRVEPMNIAIWACLPQI